MSPRNQAAIAVNHPSDGWTNKAVRTTARGGKGGSADPQDSDWDIGVADSFQERRLQLSRELRVGPRRRLEATGAPRAGRRGPDSTRRELGAPGTCRAFPASANCASQVPA